MTVLAAESYSQVEPSDLDNCVNVVSTAFYTESTQENSLESTTEGYPEELLDAYKTLSLYISEKTLL